jgi:hypothetical protein
MPDPAITFAFLVATLVGALVHLVVGGDLRNLGLLILTSWLGFAGGQLLDNTLHLSLVRIGSLSFGAGILGALALNVLIVTLLRRSNYR